MPWPANHVPKYRKHRRSGQAIVTLNGVDHYLGPHGSAASRREYDRLIHEWLAAGRRLAAAEAEASTVSVVIANYWRFAQGYYKKNGKPTSEVAAIKNAVRPLKEMYGKTPATEFGPLALKAVRSKYIANGQSRPTVNQNVGRVVRMFRWAKRGESGTGDRLSTGVQREEMPADQCKRSIPASDRPRRRHWASVARQGLGRRYGTTAGAVSKLKSKPSGSGHMPATTGPTTISRSAVCRSVRMARRK
jgi:hypothetical protein